MAQHRLGVWHRNSTGWLRGARTGRVCDSDWKTDSDLDWETDSDSNWESDSDLDMETDLEMNSRLETDLG